MLAGPRFLIKKKIELVYLVVFLCIRVLYRMSKNRGYCFTVNNYTDAECDWFKQFTDCEYLCVGKEIGESGTPHLQGYVYFTNARTIKGLKRLLGFKRAHLEQQRGTNFQASEYCKKESLFIERGQMPKQGQRTDLNEIYDLVRNGASADTIAWEHPAAYNMANRVINRLDDIRLRSQRRNFMTEGEWIFGPTGVGKSEYAFQYEDSYVYPYDGGWWDGYHCQENVVIDEFRGQLAFNELLRMVDKHPNYFCRRRGREPMPFVSKKVIITSSCPPWEIYKNLAESDSLKQLYRRFKIYKIDENGLALIDPENYLDDYASL